MIVTYNKEHVGDVLMILIKEDATAKRDVERRGKVARIFNQETNETLAWNIFEASSLVAIENNGQVFLTDADVDRLNVELAAENFGEQLVNDNTPKFVVAQIKEMVDHPDSDHLHICQVEINDGQLVQIVCGAPNAAQGLKTVAALPGAMMPSGSYIFPGKLRGEDSFGMLCSARELDLPNAPQERGIIELDQSVNVGEAFVASKHWQG